VSSASLHRRIVQGLGRQILSGKLQPGEALPQPAGVHASRTALREAIKVLTSKGLVEARPRIGTRVRARESWQLLDPDVLAWQREGPLRVKFLKDLTEVRSVIEPAAAAMAAARATAADVNAISRAYDEMAAALSSSDAKPRPASLTPARLERFVAADRRFHAAIVRASRNDLLEQMAQTVFSALTLSFRVTTSLPGAARASLPRHRKILDAIRQGRTAEARRAMLHLVGHTARQVQRIGGAR
jgi:GntR family galactonate operon transcriptional repressor